MREFSARCFRAIRGKDYMLNVGKVVLFYMRRVPIVLRHDPKTDSD